MKIALLGAMGFVGQAAARDLAAEPRVRELLLVDYNIRGAKRLAKGLAPRCRWAMADVGRAPDLARLLGGVDAVASAVGPCAEYEMKILLTCAAGGVAAASIGDGRLPGTEQREIHDAFRRAGVPAVSGCGLHPGWTDLLAAHLIPGGAGSDGAAVRYLFFRPDRFGGYAFHRRVTRARIAAPAPRGAPPGRYRSAEGDLLGLPDALAARLDRLLATLGGAGTVGQELAAAFRFWLRAMWRPKGGAGADLPAAVAGVAAGGNGPGPAVSLADAGGRLAAILLARTALRLASARGETKGLVPVPELFGRQEAQSIASSGGGRIEVA